MKVGQNTVVRWVFKLAAKPAPRHERKQAAHLRELDADQLHKVSGGDGSSPTSLPNKNW